VTFDDTGVTLLSPGVSIANGKVVAYLVVAANVIHLSGAFKDDVVSTLTINVQTGTTYAPTLLDGNGRTLVTLDNADPVTVTIPANATVAYPGGTVLAFAQVGVGLVTVVGAAGVTINGATPGDVDSAGQYASFALVQVAPDVWLASGGLA